MKFHEYLTTWQQLKLCASKRHAAALSRLSPQQQELLTWEMMGFAAGPGKSPDWATGRCLMFEEQHKKAGSPYYDVYPCMVPMLSSLDLSAVKGESIKRPHGLDAVVLRFPSMDHGLRVGGCLVRVIWFGFQPVRLSVESDEIVPGFAVGVDFGELNENKSMTVWSVRTFPFAPNESIADAERRLARHRSADYGIVVTGDDLTKCVRVALSVCLIAEDPEIVQPLPLSDDRAKYIEADAERRKLLITKARRRGKFGFALGADLETIPHFRRPHLALYHVGKGRADTKILLRKGSVVHRDRLITVPTGNLER